MSNAWRSSRATFYNFLLLFLLTGGACQVRAAETLQEIKTRGVLLWGADAEGGAPYVYPDPQKPQQLTGFEHDLADAIAAKLGVKAQMVQNQWDQLVPALERRNFDIILNKLEITPNNQQHIAISQPYFIYTQQIVTRKETERLSQLEELKGKPVNMLSGSVAERLLEKSDGTDLRIYPGNVESLRDLKAKRIEAVVMDLPIAIYYAKPDAALKFSGPSFAPGYYGIGVRKEDKSLLPALNLAIKELADDHTLERIYRKYNVWDERQEGLKEYKAEVVSERKSISTLREWPKYLPLLLVGAVKTVEISVLSMALAVVVGLVVVLVRLYGLPPLQWLAKAYV